MSVLRTKPPQIPRLPPARAEASRLIAPDILPTEDAAAAAAVAPAPTALAALLTSHVLRDGELILLILKPSFWFILFQSLGFAAAVAAGALAATLLDGRPQHQHVYLSIALFLVAGRVMWSVLQWMGRLYILTDLRILRLSGVFTVDIFDCPLRKVARTRLVLPIRERFLGLGSVEIIPKDDTLPFAVWQTVSKPGQVHEKIQAAVKKAKQSGFGCE